MKNSCNNKAHFILFPLKQNQQIVLIVALNFGEWISWKVLHCACAGSIAEMGHFLDKFRVIKMLTYEKIPLSPLSPLPYMVDEACILLLW